MYFTASIRGVDPDFDAASGFISRGNIARSNLDLRYTFYPKHSLFDTFAIDLDYADTWVYRDFTAFHAPEDRQFHPSLVATLHGGWTILYTLALETFGYDPALYTNYYLGHIAAHDTTYTRYVGGPAIANTDHNLLITTPTFAKLDVSLFTLYGHDDNFFEWSPANLWITSLTLNYRPTSQLRAQLMYNAQIFWRHNDNSIVGKTLIPRGVVENQISRPVFVRFVGQYVATYQNSLRDDGRTELPIFFLDPTGGYTRAAAFQRNQFQFQGLFAYQLIPGTVAFLGYGNTLNNVFLKFSYLFRL